MTFLLNSEELLVVTLTVQSLPASIVLHSLISRFYKLQCLVQATFSIQPTILCKFAITAKVF